LGAKFCVPFFSIFLGGKTFAFVTSLKRIFLGTTKFGGQKVFGGHCSPMPPWLRACLPRREEAGVFSA